MKVRVYVATNKLGSRMERVVEVGEDFRNPDGSIDRGGLEEFATETLQEMITWGYDLIDDAGEIVEPE